MMTQTNKLAATAALAVLGASLPALAGDAKSIVAPPEPAASKDWCDYLKTIGTIYKNSENPYIQEFKLFGRYQYQAGSIAGNDVNGDGFNAKIDQHRRVRLGGSVKFAQFFKVKVESQLVADGRLVGRDLNWGQPDIPWAAYDQVWMSFDAKKAFSLDGLDGLKLTYGRQKFLMSAEAHKSSKKIKTIERSALANTVYRGALPVGATVEAKQGSWKFAGSIYSDVLADSEWDSVIGDWSGGLAYYVSATKTFENKDELVFDFIYHDDEDDKSADWFGYDWATSVAYQGERGPWGFMANVIVADHGDVYSGGDHKPDRDGLFYGAIGQGTYWLIDDTLEVVGQYSWQGSENDEGVRTNSRLFRVDNGGDVNSGRGDSHHSLYGGLNWYLCGDSMKVMTGVEYQNIDTPDGNADATTLWAAFRMYF